MDRSEFIINNIVKDLHLKNTGVSSVAELIKDGATIPFISRYRKEKTGGLDEVAIRNVSKKLEYFDELEKRKETILKTIESLEKLTPELKDTILGCVEKNRLEDLYLPYKPKRTTRATVAREKGLEPLADIIFTQNDITASKEDIVLKYVNPEKGVSSYEEALKGALDIIAERIADTENIRGWIRKFFREKGEIIVKPRKEWKDKKSKFENYYVFAQNLMKTPPHRMLAIRRGANEEVLRWSIAVDEEQILDFMESAVIKNDSFLFKEELEKTIRDSYKRLLAVSIEVEVFMLKMVDADQEAIKVFEVNLKNLLLSPPPGRKLHDKVVVVDRRYVVEGSMNWSIVALKNNFESVTLIDSPELAEEKIARLERIYEIQKKKEGAAKREREPLCVGGIIERIEVKKALLEDEKYFPMMLKRSDRRAMDLYFILLAYSAKLDKVRFFLRLEDVGLGLGLPVSWDDEALRRQVIRALRTLEDRYGLIEVEFYYASDAYITVLPVSGESFAIETSVVDSYDKDIPQRVKFLLMIKALLEEEGKDLDLVPQEEIMRRFHITERTLEKAVKKQD